ncbi:NAD(P)-binding protein [Wilcoxina mikolae CBS 423.85]|nr:NAD(P)-binding protein [Wilcoxina mikolae CBS 423.85]
MTPPIRIGFLGLSSRQPPAWSTTTHLPYLLSPSGLSKYRIVALCNTTLTSASSARSFHNLPPTTKLYTSPTDLAYDPDVDLVVVSVNVASHYALIKPALEAGKMAFVEWPLGANLGEAEELARLAEEKGVKTVVGLQGRVDPLVDTICGIVEAGRIGDVLSSNVVAATTQMGEREGEGLRYFLEKGSGGSLVSIHFGHLIDMVQRTLGNITTFQSLLANQRKTVDITSSSGEVVEPSVPKDTADHISLHGILSSGAVLSLFVRGGKQFDPKAPAITWTIYGSKGEIEITSPNIFLQMSVDVKVRVKVGDGEPEVVEVDDEGKKGPAANVERLYEAFYNGDERVATFRDAVENHRFLEELYDGRLGEPVVFAKRGV